MVVIQDRGEVILINSGDPKTVEYTVIPFLRQQGINQIDKAIALSPKTRGWEILKKQSQIKSNVDFEKTPNLTLNSGTMALTPQGLAFDVANYHWLWLSTPLKFPDVEILPVNVLTWQGKSLNPQWLSVSKPQWAIAQSALVESQTRRLLRQDGVKLFWTGRDGAIQWSPSSGFSSFGDAEL